MHRLRIPNEVATLVRGLHPGLKRKMRAALDEILTDPLAGKALKDELEGRRSFRIGRLRIIYRQGPRQVIEIVAVGPRRIIYEETMRMMKRSG